MADLSITVGNVAMSTPAPTRSQVQFGEAVAQGQSVYLKASDSKWYKADADLSAEAAGSGGLGIALTKGSADDFGFVVTAGLMNIGATLTVGEIYVVSGTAGGICPEADLSTGERVSILGVATTTSLLSVKPFASGAVIP